jgi:hypothetical protein
MRLKSFTTVAIRLIGLMSLVYGLLTLIFMALTFFVFSDLGSVSRLPGVGSMLWIQFLLPALMVLLGIFLIASSRSLAGLLSSGLEE